MYSDVVRWDLSEYPISLSIRATVAKIWSILGQILAWVAGSRGRRRALVVGTHRAPAPPPSRAQIWARIDHIFATVARIDKLIGYSERGRRTTSEYTIYLIKLARPKKSSELFEIFGKKSWKLFLMFQNFFKIFKISEIFSKTFFNFFLNFFSKTFWKKFRIFFWSRQIYQVNRLFRRISTRSLRIIKF